MNMEIVKHAKTLVKAKYELDLFLQGYKKEKIISRLYNQAVGFQIPPDVKHAIAAIQPMRFVEYTLPFIKYTDQSPQGIEEVDPFLVIGATYNIYKESDEPEELRISRLNTLSIESTAEYYQIGNFPLYFAQEGKNRVLMYQKNNKPIRAVVSKLKYPKAEELILYKVLPYNIHALGCLNEEFYSTLYLPAYKPVILPFPRLVLPLLKSYGVKKKKIIFSPLAIYEKYLIIKELTNATINLGVGCSQINMPMGIND